MDKTISIDELMLFLKSIKKQCKYKGTPYFSGSQMMDFYNEFGDDVSKDGVITPNAHRLDVMNNR